MSHTRTRSGQPPTPTSGWPTATKKLQKIAENCKIATAADRHSYNPVPQQSLPTWRSPLSCWCSVLVYPVFRLLATATLTPCVTFRPSLVALPGTGQSPVLPSTKCASDQKLRQSRCLDPPPHFCLFIGSGTWGSRHEGSTFVRHIGLPAKLCGTGVGCPRWRPQNHPRHFTQAKSVYPRPAGHHTAPRPPPHQLQTLVPPGALTSGQAISTHSRSAPLIGLGHCYTPCWVRMAVGQRVETI